MAYEFIQANTAAYNSTNGTVSKRINTIHVRKWFMNLKKPVLCLVKQLINCLTQHNVCLSS